MMKSATKVESLYRFDDSRMPLILGPAVGIPSYAYPNWDIPLGAYRKESDERYMVEWEGGSPTQMQYVTDAITRVGYGDFPQMLRDANARVISRLVKKINGKINILDVGAGKSTVTIFDELDDNDKNRTYFSLLEPSEERVEAAASELSKRGLRREKEYKVIVGSDLEIPNHFDTESQHIVSYVATLHHHAYIDTPLRYISSVTVPKGFFTSADWHNSMWEHPNRVYKFLQEFDWETKEQDIKEFVKMFPKTLEDAPKLRGSDEKANEMIKDFWRGWIEVRKEAIEKSEFDSRDDIWLLEGHRPVERYIEEMHKIGYKTDTENIKDVMTTNPWSLLPDSSLLMLVVGEKIQR